MELQPFCETEIQFLSKQNLIESLLNIYDRNILLVLSSSSAYRFHLLDTLQIMKQNNNTVTWIDNVNTNPTPDDLLSSLKLIGKQAIDLIIAIGGGSAIDLAKGISAFYDASTPLSTIDQIITSVKYKSYQTSPRFIDIIAVPTTAGTGSELTPWATIWDREQQVKYSIDSTPLKPKKALIVPEFTSTLSKEMTLISGLDSLSHSIEAYWSKHTTPVVQDLAYRSIQLILMNLPKVLINPDNLHFRENMCRASVLAGMAFSITRTTACHSISYPITMLFGVPHGIAAAMTLGVVADKNRGMFPNDQDLFDLFNQYGGLQHWLNELCTGISSLRLSHYNILPSDIDLLVNKAFTGGRIDNNPVSLTIQDVREILISIY